MMANNQYGFVQKLGIRSFVNSFFYACYVVQDQRLVQHDEDDDRYS